MSKTSIKEDVKLSKKLDENTKLIKELFVDVDIMVSRPFENVHDARVKYCIFYSDGVVDSQLINDSIIKPLAIMDKIKKDDELFDNVMNSFVLVNEIAESSDMDEIIDAICYGDTVLLIDGFDKAIIVNSKNFFIRSVAEPEGERVLYGPREGFVENLMMNLSMLRRKLRTNELKVKFQST